MNVLKRHAQSAVYVIATEGPEEAAAGLAAAEPLALRQNAPLVLLVPHIVPYGTDINACGHSLMHIGNRFRPAADRVLTDVTIHVCACREARHLFARMVVMHATVVVPGHKWRWRRSPSERLAHALACEGHDVVFIDLAGDTPSAASAAHREGQQRPQLSLVHSHKEAQ